MQLPIICKYTTLDRINSGIRPTDAPYLKIISEYPRSTRLWKAFPSRRIREGEFMVVTYDWSKHSAYDMGYVCVLFLEEILEGITPLNAVYRWNEQIQRRYVPIMYSKHLETLDGINLYNTIKEEYTNKKDGKVSITPTPEF